MPFFIPLNVTEQQPVTVAVLFSSATDLVVDGEVELHAPVTFGGTTTFTVSGATILSGATTFNGDTHIDVAGRLNADPDVFGTTVFNGATALVISAQGIVTSPLSFSGATELAVDAFLQAAESYGFTIFVDITDAALQTVLQPSNNIRRYNARLVVDGTAIPIIRAELQSPPDKLGTELTVILADPNVSLISSTASINFDIALWVSGAWQWINILTGGRLSGRAARYVNEEGLPKDAVEVSFVDIIGDRWNRAPREQIILYDPQQIDPPTSEAINSQSVFPFTATADVQPSIVPTFVSMSNLKLYDVLHYAYVTGCGFTKVVTNIINFPVEQAQFTMTGGYDAGVRPLLEMFSPVVFASGNDLWIIDPDQPLPAGISAVDFVAAFSASIDDTLPAHEPINGILVRVKNDGSLGDGDFYTERLETSTVGSLGAEVDTQRRIREYRSFAAPTKIIREEVTYTRTRTLGPDFAVLGVETRTDHFDSLNRPTGYSVTTDLLLPDVSNPINAFLQSALDEEQLITYTTDPLNPKRDIESRIETRTSGSILVDAGNLYRKKPFEMPYVDAHKSGYLTGDPKQSTRFGTIRTVIEQLLFNGSQIRYETRVTNHIADVPDKLTVKTLPGDPGIDRRTSGGDQQRYVLLTVPGSDAVSRRVAEFDGTQLPYATAIALAQRRLNNLNNPPKELAVNMAYVNPSLRRGAVVHVQGRSGYLGNYIIKGLTLVIEGIDLRNYKASMNFSARELRVV